jgi:succinate dehydrogenase flavin-adding protein (antitoxin of CptAB toxin-antitoxin module)
MLELDLYFDRFIKYGKLDALSEVELNAYADLLELEDNKLLLLLQGNLVLENHYSGKELKLKIWRKLCQIYSKP